MKFLHLLVLFTLFTTFCKAQVLPNVKSNIIAQSEFENIKIKGKTLAQIEATQGNEQNLYFIFGSYTSKDDSKGSDYVTYNYGLNAIVYDYVLNRVVSIIIRNQDWPVSVKGEQISVGKTIQELQNKFGSSFQIFESDYGPEKFSGFTYSGNDYNAIDILFNTINNSVEEITYFILP